MATMVFALLDQPDHLVQLKVDAEADPSGYYYNWFFFVVRSEGRTIGLVTNMDQLLAGQRDRTRSSTSMRVHGAVSACLLEDAE